MDTGRTIPSLIEALNARLQSDDGGLTAAIDLAVLVAAADGQIDRAEQAALAASLEGLVGSQLDPAVVRHLIRESRDQIQAVGPELRARAIGEFLAAHDAALEGLRLAIAIGYASEGLSAVERERITRVAQAAGVGVERVDALIREARTSAGA
jgi:tellurite resistance protein